MTHIPDWGRTNYLFLTVQWDMRIVAQVHEKNVRSDLQSEVV